MNILQSLIVPLAVGLAVLPATSSHGDTDFAKIAPRVAMGVSELLEQSHYSKRKLDDSVSKQLLKDYLESLDRNHLFFTQKDVDGFSAQYATTLDDALHVGETEPAIKIYTVYRQRIEDRVAKVKELLKQTFDFKSTRTIELDRKKSPWPKDEAEADSIWKDRLEGEMLDRVLVGDKVDSPVKVLTRRYDQLLRTLHEQGDEDIISNFLNTLATTYDPHSEYMSRSQLDSFNISMSLQLVGIGAVLNSEEGYAKIRELVPGGPAAESGRIKVGDRVCAVAQGTEPFVETVDMKLDKVVELIRGQEDTVVRLRIIPVGATDPAERKEIEIIRKKVKLKEQEAKAEIVERTQADGSKQRLGWITLPSFYADFQHSAGKDSKSMTKDVSALLERLKKENIQGLVMDLRRNGGGSLEEARDLTGLFIKGGPIVQVRDGNDKVSRLSDRDQGKVAYDGPMIILTNKLSASASEIFAAALQDYNRAVIVGDSTTFGKGTVQTMADLHDFALPTLSGNGNANDAGALKLTIQKFYRISGGSTQMEGVRADVKLPSGSDISDFGESALNNPLPYDTINPASFEKVEKDLYKEDLKSRSGARVSAEPEFRWITEDVERFKKHISENKVSLNEATRRAELSEGKARKEKRAEERSKIKVAADAIFSVTLDNLDKSALEPKKEKEKAKPSEAKEKLPPEPKTTDPKTPAPDIKPPAATDAKPDLTKPDIKANDDDDDDVDEPMATDPIRSEALNILRDLVEFTHHGPPSTAANKAKTAAH